MKRGPSSRLLALCSLVLVGIGLYFAFLRPDLLPEDARYMHSSVQEIENALPGLPNWLDKVFWVMGGYMVTGPSLRKALRLYSLHTGHMS